VVLLWVYFVRLEHYVGLDAKLWRPAGPVIRRILNVGLPAGGEFFMMFVIMAVVYWAIRGFGPPAQAGFGIGSRVMQALFLPVMALAFAVAPVAGQNMGARQYPRVRESFRHATLLSVVLMFALTLVCQWRPEVFVRLFTDQADVIEVGATYLRVISWNFVATGIIFSCSGLFQALGNTVPSLLSSASRILTYVLPVVWMSRRPGFQIVQVWHLSVATVTLQALISYLLLRREFRLRLPAPAAGAEPAAGTAVSKAPGGAP
jgi:Na+-driven multidrug efflux pump